MIYQQLRNDFYPFNIMASRNKPSNQPEASTEATRQRPYVGPRDWMSSVEFMM